MSHEKQLIDFVNEIFKIADWPEGADIDGLDMQDAAEKHGILIPEIRHQPCGEFCMCAESCLDDDDWEKGVKCFRKAEFLSSVSEYTRPELTKEDLKKTSEWLAGLFHKHGVMKTPQVLETLVLENVRLLKEVNEHRAARGIDPLPTFEV